MGDGLVSPSGIVTGLEVAVMQLHRAVEHRDTLLNEMYGFQDIPHFWQSELLRCHGRVGPG